MPSIETIVHLTGSYGPFLAVALATFILLDTTFRSIARKRRETSAINKRLKVLEETSDRQEALIELRRQRGLSAEGGYILPVVALNRLLVQSGLEIRLNFFLLTMVALATMVGSFAYILFAPLPVAMAFGFFAGVVCPLLLLAAYRSRRLRQIEEQLPEAVDVMVRSLRAGHPIPIAIALVGREMPDPIGSEFGMVSDEMTYGLDLPTAMGNLRERTGQMDIALLVVAISIQSKTGGNLAELLSNLGNMIRERYRVRRRIHALSAEGRFSSIALSLVPVVVYLVVQGLAPTYYGDVQQDPLYTPAVYLAFTLWIIGVVTIRRMVSFKI